MEDKQLNIAQLLERQLISASEREESEHEGKKFNLSDMGKCLRMRWVKRKGVKTSFDPHVLWVLRMGNILHDYGYKALESQGILLATEEVLENKHFKGRYDGIVKDYEGKALFDFKSAGAYKIQKAMNGEEDEQYIAQILSYHLLLRETNPELAKELVKTCVIYINKEPSDKVPVTFLQKDFHLTKKREEWLTEEMDKLVDYWEKDEVPPCTCPAWMKPYNAYQPFCEMDAKKLKVMLDNLKKGKIISNKTGVTLKTEAGEEKLV